ncbi:uncharacterized protein LOC132720982 isoform X2 [Ruditapes philippinarum]|uniref:uncharacterized protein LOC132720982 isoform X2 n=1 Tax=Ruditapes philippinarum TaxID=129788 RepID=UPI00295BE055|nr:uncharacterized protein LOC132720982 isoform X2 [Ruditapes philippinarum]
MENVLFWIIFGVTQIARASGDICFNFDRDFTYIEFECDDGCCGTDSMNQECCDKKCCGMTVSHVATYPQRQIPYPQYVTTSFMQNPSGSTLPPTYQSIYG